MITRTRLPYLDGEPFICMLEDAQDEGDSRRAPSISPPMDASE